MDAIITEKRLRENPELVKAFTGLPEQEFWALVQAVEAQLPAYEDERHTRPIYTPIMQVVCGLVNRQTQRCQAAQAAAVT